MYSTAHIDKTISSLRDQISAHESQLRILKSQLAQAEQRASNVHELIQAHDLDQAYRGGVMPEWQQETWDVLCNTSREDEVLLKEDGEMEQRRKRWQLELEEYKRYGRQLILPEIGLQGQLRLKDAAVCIVGAGGLGCPAAAYLAGAGVGTIGLVDGDTVEVSNLHRQVLHSTEKVGMPKVESVSEYINALNPNVKVVTHPSHLSASTALETLRPYALILDCTDSPQSRYLISDACVLLCKPLVSASALRTDGQLMLLNHPPYPQGNPSGGPCYRCVFPKPPPPESVVSCGEGGILGPVVGVMGVLQALEAIKLVAAGLTEASPQGASPSPDTDVKLDDDDNNNKGEGADQKPPHPQSPTLLLFSATASPPFRSIRLRSRRPTCAACSSQASISSASLTSGSLDYAQFCGLLSPVDVLGPDDRISASQYAQWIQRQQRQQQIREADPGGEVDTTPRREHVLVDVRESTQFALCSLPGSVNIPISELVSPQGLPVADGKSGGNGYLGLKELDGGKDVVVVCRFGNDSQLAVQRLKKTEWAQGSRVVDIKGGLRAWREEVDEGFPEY